MIQNELDGTIIGLICAEGESWREHRRFVMNVMKQLGMAGRQGASLMESRVMDRVLEFIQVKNLTTKTKIQKTIFYFFGFIVKMSMKRRD